MKTLITRASMVAGLTGAILFANVAVETAAPGAPASPVAARARRQVTIPAGTVLRLRLEQPPRLGVCGTGTAGASESQANTEV